VTIFRFFSQTKYASFQRQLNIYGFNRFLRGQDKGAYYHLCFVRGHRSLVRNMVRRKIKGTGVTTARETMERESKFNFYLPMWKNHFEPIMPSPEGASKDNSRDERVVSPASVPSSIDFALAAPVSPVASTPFAQYNQAAFCPPVSQPAQNESASYVSEEDLSSMLMEPLVDDADDLLALFEGNTFHMLNQPTPAVVEPPSGCSSCDCICGKNRSFQPADLEPLPLF